MEQVLCTEYARSFTVRFIPHGVVAEATSEAAGEKPAGFIPCPAECGFEVQIVDSA
jgi:hypothetical protein